MVKVTYITHAGVEQTVDVAEGTSLMEGALNNGVDGIEAVCGGNCYCGTCRIYVTPEWMARLPAAQEEELGMIEASGEEDPSARLACQVMATPAIEGIRVTTPEFQK